MKRDMLKVVETMEKVPSAYGMTYSEMTLLLEKCKEDKIHDALLTAFEYGFALARRMEKNKRKRGKAV